MSVVHNQYFGGRVQSLGFVREGVSSTVAVLAPGEYTFVTQAPERMTVVSGSYSVRLPGEDWCIVSTGDVYDVASGVAFDLKVGVVAVHLCDYLPVVSV